MNASPITDADLDRLFGPIYTQIAEGTVDRELHRTLPFAQVALLLKAGFGALRVPCSHGGFGATLPQLLRQLMKLGQADSNLPQIFRAHFGFVEGRLSSNDAVSQERWFSHVVAGELWGAAMAERSKTTSNTVRLKDDKGGYRLNGEKFYCTGTLYADWVAAIASHGNAFVSLLVPTSAPGVDRINDWDGFGQCMTGSGTTRFENVFVQPDQILRWLDMGELRGESYLTAFYQAIHLATLAGIGHAVLADTVTYVQSRSGTSGGASNPKPIDDPLVQAVVGRLASLAFAAEAQVIALGQSLQTVFEAGQANEATAQLYTDAEIQAFQGQQIVPQQVLEACTLMFEVGGASATSNTRCLDRHWRNARTLASHNPAIYREQALGNYYLNGVRPALAWRALHSAVGERQGYGDEASAV